MLSLLWEELTAGLPDSVELTRVTLRLITSALLGAAVGFERERAGKPAGLRTHVLVCLGTAIVLVACDHAGMSRDALSRVVQGLITGIGFLGAGSILKLNRERQIQGLTTAAGIWTTAGVGVAVGVGSLGVATLATVVTLVVLRLVPATDAGPSAPGVRPPHTDARSD